MKQIFLITLLLSISNAFSLAPGNSCTVNGPSIYSYAASLDKGITYMYNDGGRISAEHDLGIYVNNCKKAAGKFLMVGFGVNDSSLDASTTGTIYSNKLAKTKCSIKNSTLPNIMTYAERAEIHRTKSRFLELCVETTVAHNSGKPLRYRANQIGCNIEKVSAQRVIIHPSSSSDDNATAIKSNFCYFQIYGDSEFVVGHKIKKECTDPNFLKANNLEPMEVNAGTTFGIVGKPTGHSKDLELLPSKVTNFTLEPSSKQLTITEDWGRDIPQLPANFRLPDLEFGDIKITQSRDSANITFPFLVDNRCKKECFDELCSSACNYSQPIVGEITLSQIIKGKKEYLKSWYDGAVAPSNWQGFLGMSTQYLESIIFEKDAEYEIEVLFRDPKTDYTMYSKSTTPLFRALPGVPTVNFAAALFSGIPTIAGIQYINGINTISSLPDYGSIKDFGQYYSDVKGIEKLSKFSFWPPYYDQTCGPRGCKEIGSKPYLSLNLKFNVKEIEENGNIKLNNINITKRSTVFPESDIKISNLPKIVCPWD